MVIVLSAGKASRMGGQCKALVDVAGVRAVDRQAALTDQPIRIVVRAIHETQIRDAGYDPVVCDELGGPIRALRAGLDGADGAVTVLFADTMLGSLPDGSDWVLWDEAHGGREWDGINPTTGWAYRIWYPPHAVHKVCVGAYSFADPDRLRHAIDRTPDDGPFAWLLNAYPTPLQPHRADGWQDVGTPEALAEFTEGGTQWRSPTATAH